MADYGLKIYDTASNFSLITNKLGKIVSSGTLTMSETLEGDGTYGEDVALGGIYSVTNLAAIAFPTIFNYKIAAMCMPWHLTDAYPFNFYLYKDYAYYTKNTSTGIMTTFTAGNITMEDGDSFDGVASVFPLAGWDYVTGVTTISNLRIWAATTYVIYDSSETAFNSVYSIGSDGVSEVEYMVFLKG